MRTPEHDAPTRSPLGPLARYEQAVIDQIEDLKDPHQEWRRLFAELFGTFFLVLVAAGGGKSGSAAAQGDPFTELLGSGKA